MLQQCASHVVDALYKSSTLDTARRPIYQYATELTLSTIAAAISVLLLAALLGNALWGVIFLVVFISLRLPGGGYHASTYRNCFVLTNGVFLSSFIAAALLNQISNGIVFFVLLGSCATIWILAPIPNPHHPVSKQTLCKNKHIVRGMVVVGAAFTLLGAFFSFHSLFSIYSASVAAVAAMMILAKLRGGI